MEKHEIDVAVGQRVRISRPGADGRFTGRVERFARVTAIRAKSFDAGGLCFRRDGREWNGHNRVFLVPIEEASEDTSLIKPHEAILMERAERAREDVTLAFLLSCQHEKQWLRLGLNELRRIAALHGIAPGRGEAGDTAGVGALP